MDAAEVMLGHVVRDSPSSGRLGGCLQGSCIAHQTAWQHDGALVLEHAVHCVLQLFQVCCSNRVWLGQPAAGHGTITGPHGMPAICVQPECMLPVLWAKQL